MTRKALIMGASIAGLSCAKLLTQSGWKVEVHASNSLNLPTLVLNDISCNLLFDIWRDNNNNSGLFDDSYSIKQRNVYWGPVQEKSVVNQLSTVIKGNNLINRLLKKLDNESYNICIYLDKHQQGGVAVDRDFELSSRMRQSFEWVIDATGRTSYVSNKLGFAKHYSFGQRCMISAEVELHDSHMENASWIESLEGGWVFLAPVNKDMAILQAMVPMNPGKPSFFLAYLLNQTRLIKKLITEIKVDSITVFKAYPQITSPLCGSNWICIGDAALSFDPLCGDGTGQAIRGAILASAIINGIRSGLSKEVCFRHYSMRLANAFFNHVTTCIKYYSAISSDLWKSEIDLMKKPFPYSLNSYDNFLFRLNGFNLTQKKE